MSSQREMSREFPVVEDISRSASAEGSFGAGELNEQREAGRALQRGSDYQSESAVGFHAIPALQERDVCTSDAKGIDAFGKSSHSPAAHNEGGTALTSPFTRLVSCGGLVF